MAHICTPACQYQIDLDAAVAGLKESSRLLSDSLYSGPKESIEGRVAAARAAWLNATGAQRAYRDHLSGSNS